MTPVHAAAVVVVSTPPIGWRGACTCAWTGERQGAFALAERDAAAHAKHGNRCRRRPFQSREAAERYAVDRRQKAPVFAEFCADPDCRGWHLTSQPQSVTA